MKEAIWTGNGLSMPDLRKQFKHLHWRPMPHAFGVDVASDWADKDDGEAFGIFKNCGLWTMCEAAILFNVSRRIQGGRALDIGSHTGWTSAHILAGGHPVVGVDPMYASGEFVSRTMENTLSGVQLTHRTSAQYFGDIGEPVKFSLICVDGDHEPGEPLKDAVNAAKHLADTGVIIFHDGVGQPVQEAVEYLMVLGFKCRAYFTPHLVFCCFRGNFEPPDHVADPDVKRQLLDGRFKEFDFTRCV